MTRITTEPTELSTISSAVDDNGHFNIVGNATFYNYSANYGAIDGTITCSRDDFEECNFGTSLSCTYSLTGPEAEYFEIIGNKLRLKTGTILNYQLPDGIDKYTVFINNACDNENHPEFTLHILDGVAP